MPLSLPSNPAAVGNEREAPARTSAAIREREPIQEHASGSDRGEQEEEGAIRRGQSAGETVQLHFSLVIVKVMTRIICLTAMGGFKRLVVVSVSYLHEQRQPFVVVKMCYVALAN